MIEVQAEACPADVEKAQSGHRRFTIRRWMLLPLAGILPVIVIIGLSELIARKVYVESSPTSHPCLVLNDPTTGVRGYPVAYRNRRPTSKPAPMSYDPSAVKTCVWS